MKNIYKKYIFSKYHKYKDETPSCICIKCINNNFYNI